MNNIKDIRICFIGDSFVNGTGDPEHLGWVGRACALSHNALSHNKAIEITHYNLGIRGDTSEDINARWENESVIRLPDHAESTSENTLVFSFGVNDTTIENGRQRVNVQKSIETTKDILSRASKKYNVLMIGPPPIDDTQQNERICELNKHFQSACEELAIPYLSIFESLLEEPVWLKEISSNDGAHPRSAGYTCLAKLVHAWDKWPKC